MESNVQKWLNHRKEEEKRKEDTEAKKRKDKRERIKLEARYRPAHEDKEEEAEPSKVTREDNKQPNVSSPRSPKNDSRPGIFPLTPPSSLPSELPGHSPDLSSTGDATVNKEEVSEAHIESLCTKIEALESQITSLAVEVKNLRKQLQEAHKKEKEAINEGKDVEPLLLKIKQLNNCIDERDALIDRLNNKVEDFREEELKLRKALHQREVEALERPIVSLPPEQPSEVPQENHKTVQPNPELDTNPPQKKSTGDKVCYIDYRYRMGGHMRKWPNGEKESSHIRYKPESRKPEI